MDYAIVKTGGRQYTVKVGDVIDVNTLDAQDGASVELTEVLAVSAGGEFTVGTPVVAGARVVAEVTSHGKDSKVTVFKFKRKRRYHRTRGHRQQYTRLAIKEIVGGG